MGQPSWLNLADVIPWRQVRALVWRHASSRVDRLMVRMAHGLDKDGWHPWLCAEVAREGSVAILQWVWKRQLPYADWGLSTTDAAMDGCQVAALDWLLDKNCPWRGPGMCMTLAAERGHVSLLAWCVKRYLPSQCATPLHLLLTAARCGNTNVLDWLLAHGCPWDGAVVVMAGSVGNIHVLEWAYDKNGADWIPLHTVDAAAHNGQVDVLLWLRDHGISCVGAYSNAIIGDRLDVVKALRANGFEWERHVLHLTYGRPGIRQWLLDNGYPAN
jgi:hypothetical protein